MIRLFKRAIEDVTPWLWTRTEWDDTTATYILTHELTGRVRWEH